MSVIDVKIIRTLELAGDEKSLMAQQECDRRLDRQTDRQTDTMQ